MATLRLCHTRFLVGLAMVALLGAACGELGGPRREADRAIGGGAPPVEDHLLDQPLGSLGVEVSNVDEAALPFVAVQPTGIGKASKLFAYVPQGEPAAAMVAWVFQSPTYGDFVAIEYLGAWTEAEMAQEASPVPSPGCTSTVVTDGDGREQTLLGCTYNNFTTVSLPGDHTGLLGQDESTTSITWAEPVVQPSGESKDLEGLNVVVVLRGSPDAFSREQATAAATAMLSGQG